MSGGMPTQKLRHDKEDHADFAVRVCASGNIVTQPFVNENPDGLCRENTGVLGR